MPTDSPTFSPCLYYRDARAAIILIREAVEDCAPPGSVPREGYLSPDFTERAEALVRGIYAIAGLGLYFLTPRGKREGCGDPSNLPPPRVAGDGRW